MKTAHRITEQQRANFVRTSPAWPASFGVFTGSLVDPSFRVLHATFIFESDAWRYILARGLRAVAWVERI